MADHRICARMLWRTRSSAGPKIMRSAQTLGIAISLSFFCLVDQRAYGADPTDPLNRISGTYAGNIEWSGDPAAAQPSTGDGMIAPVVRVWPRGLSFAVMRGDDAAILSWTYDGETLAAWIDGSIGTDSYHAPAGAEILCRPSVTQVGSATPASELWLSCEPPGPPGKEPRILMALAIVDKTADGTAEWLFLRFKRYENEFQVLWENAEALLRRQTN